jgi:peptide-methionine (S)-S-oxide reductase
VFYEAEDYHQNYYNNNQEAGYCQFVIDPKVQKLKKMYADKLIG